MQILKRIFKKAEKYIVKAYVTEEEIGEDFNEGFQPLGDTPQEEAAIDPSTWDVSKQPQQPSVQQPAPTEAPGEGQAVASVFLSRNAAWSKSVINRLLATYPNWEDKVVSAFDNSIMRIFNAPSTSKLQDERVNFFMRNPQYIDENPALRARVEAALSGSGLGGVDDISYLPSIKGVEKKPFLQALHSVLPDSSPGAGDGLLSALLKLSNEGNEDLRSLVNSRIWFELRSEATKQQKERAGVSYSLQTAPGEGGFGSGGGGGAGGHTGGEYRQDRASTVSDYNRLANQTEQEETPEEIETMSEDFSKIFAGMFDSFNPFIRDITKLGMDQWPEIADISRQKTISGQKIEDNIRTRLKAPEFLNIYFDALEDQSKDMLTPDHYQSSARATNEAMDYLKKQEARLKNGLITEEEFDQKTQGRLAKLEKMMQNRVAWKGPWGSFIGFSMPTGEGDAGHFDINVGHGYLKKYMDTKSAEKRAITDMKDKGISPDEVAQRLQFDPGYVKLTFDQIDAFGVLPQKRHRGKTLRKLGLADYYELVSNDIGLLKQELSYQASVIITRLMQQDRQDRPNLFEEYNAKGIDPLAFILSFLPKQRADKLGPKTLQHFIDTPISIELLQKLKGAGPEVPPGEVHPGEVPGEQAYASSDQSFVCNECNRLETLLSNTVLLRGKLRKAGASTRYVDSILNDIFSRQSSLFELIKLGF